MSFISADIDQLMSLKSTFEQQSSVVQDLTSTIRGQLANTLWQGPNASRFRDMWTSEYEPTLRQLGESLLDAGREVGMAAQRLLQAGG